MALSTPKLDELVKTPERVGELSVEVLLALLCQCVSLQNGLLGALIAVSGRQPRPNSEPDSLLDVETTAKRLGMSPDWLYRHARELPFTVSGVGRRLRFSSHGIGQYIARRQGRAAK